MATNEGIKSLGSILVTGGCGFVGSYIVQMIRDRHPETKIAVVDIRTERNRHAGNNISYYDADITSAESIEPVFAKSKPDVIIHTASPAFENHEVVEKVNVGGTKCLLEVSKRAGVKAFVYTSSASVISDQVHDLCNADETYPVLRGEKQPDHYTRSKAEAEFWALEANDRTGMLTCALRPAGIVGAGALQVIQPMYNAYKAGQTKWQLGENNNMFDFTSVQNVAHAHLLAAAALLNTKKLLTAGQAIGEDERVDGEAFFITNDEPVYFWDMSRFVWKNLGDKTALNVTRLGKDTALFISAMLDTIMPVFGRKPSLSRTAVNYSCMTRYYNIAKAKSRLGYESVQPLEDSLKESAKWFLDEQVETPVKA